MPLAQQTATVSLALSIGVGLVAALLVYWLWHDRRHRDPVLSEEDARHFGRQDFRRGLVALILVVLAVGISVGSRIDPRPGGRTNPLFVQIWLGVFALILVLLLLAMFDWLATRLYARRHFRELAKERLEILREEMRRRSGRGGDAAGPLGGTPEAGTGASG